ncbi:MULTISPECIES: hypothetical protein [Xanthomonas]|uniref:Uncharacterized protein n=2 Tax=Xanthomonas TaxID=338 RepID=A0A7Z7J397_XANCH|nr:MULTISPECIES: hypothetical protein [Xanthomonas]ATS38792.1 hypothetical protein XcfCFBP6988P_12210 [Xanthomonas citri pv. phaseoli var. fuscans]ATS42404.1 hypothetical protein XcfCFBP6989P_08275 [Xanthomonas citri pv. phaseoli var. fuscans]ATS46793.1 hypothetical protein XcfCFBP6990P_09080 [Xanthomonas citri pv. phaseoli var. fuscans]ATS82946.1 hypothetical protein XcfCFBP6991P_02380 [Xanthomonas citri pv. phaseoli var. fuscans]MDH4907795.1 hypothetical protein [Xanthomonas euvesicatoria]
MSASALQTLRELYPQRYALRPDEVAHVLRGQSTRGVVQRVREGMQSGRYPGARKIDGLIQMPLDALAEILDPAPSPQPVVPTITPSVSRRRSAIGPRLSFVRASRFWEGVMGAIGEAELAVELAEVAEKVLRELRYEEAGARASRELEILRADFR